MSDKDISSFVVSYGSKNADVDIMQRDGQRFYNATKLYQTFGTGAEGERVSHFLLKDATRAFIIQKYTELTVNEEKPKEIKDLLEVTDSNFLDMTAVHSYLSDTNKKSLPAEIRDLFVYTKKGRGAATYLSEALFIDYAMHLSPQVKSVVIETFRKYGWIEFLPQSERADALLGLSLQEEVKNISEQYPTVSSEPALEVDSFTAEEVDDARLFRARIEESAEMKAALRLKSKLTTKLVKDLLYQIVKNEKRVFGSELEEQEYVSQYFTALFDTLNVALFKHPAKRMKELVGLETGAIRDSMTMDCLLAIDSAESNIQRELHQILRARIRLTKDMLKTLVIQCCELPSANLFKYAREIDFLVRDKRIAGTNQVKQIDVTLDEDYKTRTKTTVVELPKKNTSKKIVSDKQQSLFGDIDS